MAEEQDNDGQAQDAPEAEGNLMMFARSELAIAGLTDGDEYNGMVAEAALDLVKLFSRQGHSGFSASMTTAIVEKLMRFEPLTPLTGADDEWTDLGSGGSVLQNKRCSHVFKENGEAYDSEGRVFVHPDGAGFTSRDSRVPVTFPYVPKTERINVGESGEPPAERRDTRPLEETSIRALDQALQVAFYAAANALVHIDATADSMRWPYLGDAHMEGHDVLVEDVAVLGRFVRQNPSAPPEALWRYAHGQGIHAAPVDGFFAAPRAQALPYRIFALVLPGTDAQIAEHAALEAQAARAIAPPPQAGPNDTRGTVMEQFGSIFDRTEGL